MDFVTLTLLLYAAINVLALVWSAAIIQFGVPPVHRIQNRTHSWSTLGERLPLVLFNQALLMAMVYVALGQLGWLFTASTPSIGVLVVQITIIMLSDDAWFYVWHRLMHEHKGLYNKIHRIHHRAFAPLPIEYIYVHPLEWIVGAIGPTVGLLLVAQFNGSVPALTLWVYVLVRNLHELDVHSGIKSPFGKRVPIYAASEHHDLHHAKPTKGNYATTFELWDRMLGTYWRP